MAVIVKPLSKNFQVKFKHEDEEIIFTFHQLNYKTKSEITSMVTNVRNGQVTIDATLQVFYNIKYGRIGLMNLNTDAVCIYGSIFAIGLIIFLLIMFFKEKE